ncbi:MAG: glycoside hydrolase family 92 protein [Lentisphaerae bacterium]|nr:glycoside hydrolase family 92 protein [Lentisphaerota bacterium]
MKDSSVTINGKTLDRSWVTHDELKDDTVLAFTMGDKPTAWGTRTPPPSDLGDPIRALA